MICPTSWCTGRKVELILVSEEVVNRIRGNNYDIFTWEQIYECPRCAHVDVKQETIRECAGMTDSMMDEQFSTDAPARFGT